MKTFERSQLLRWNGVQAPVRRTARLRVPSGRSFGSTCFTQKRASFGMRVVWDDVEEFSTATVKTSVPTVNWREDFDDKYALEKEVASGSFGKVWKASDKDTGEVVAVKRLQTQRGNLCTEKIRGKVDQEMGVLMDLQDHPGVVNLHGCYIQDDHYNVVMDFCDGDDLKAHVQESGPISEGLCAAVAWEILGVLKKCREAKVVHGDIKAANFIVSSKGCNPFRSTDVVALPSGWLKAVDFGAGRYFRGRPKDVIRGRCGTPLYMAPEVLWGYYGYEADMWSVGITLFYLLSGRFPLWETEEAALQQSLTQVKEAVFRQPMRVDPEAMGNPSPSCVDFLRRLLIRNSKFRMSLEDAERHPFFEENLALCGNGVVILGANNIVTSTSKANLCASSWVLDGMKA